MRRQPVNDSQVLVLNPHPSLEYVMSCHSRHFLISLLILSAIACPVGGAELTMAADPPAGSITNHGAVLWFFVKGVYDSCLAIFPIINSWGRDNERVLVAQYWCWSLIVWASSVAPADTLGSESLVLANLSLLQPCCPVLFHVCLSSVLPSLLRQKAGQLGKEAPLELLPDAWFQRGDF